MRLIAILFLAVVDCVLFVCAARLLSVGFAESERRQFELNLKQEAEQNIRKNTVVAENLLIFSK